MPTLASECDTIERALWTSDDFLDWLEPGIHADLIDGEKFMHSPVSLTHANQLNFLDCLLRMHLEKSGLGGLLYREVVAVRLSSRNVFLPDLAWFTPEQVPLLGETHAPLAPKWVCEALSRVSAAARIARASSKLTAIRASQRTCLPAASAEIVTGALKSEWSRQSSTVLPT